MSCFKVRRLLPKGKAWRVFTKKLQMKLHNLQNSRAIRKPKQNQFKSTRQSVFWAALSLQSHRDRKKRTAKVQRFYPSRLQKRNAPVYVDQLFVESVSTSTTATGNQNFSPFAKKGKLVDPQKVVFPATNTEQMHSGSRNTTTAPTADDLWESLVLASPQMHGINERAEEFITRFRAEMQLQEISASQLYM